MNEHFVYRDKCPACKNDSGNVLCDVELCDSPLHEYLDTLYREVGPGVDFDYLAGARYKLIECDSCGLIFQAEVPNDNLLNKLYNEWLDPEITKRNSQQRSVKFRLRIATEVAKIVQYLEKPSDKVKFLDFGMGWGHWCLAAKAFGCDVYGAELGAENIQHAKQLNIKDIAWGSLPEHKFDIINSEQVFEHLPKPIETLEYLSNSLAEQGIIRINVPSAWDLKRRLKVWDWKASLSQSDENTLNDAAPLQHINSFVRKPLISMAKEVGLKVVEIKSINAPTNKTLVNNIKSNFKPFYKALMPEHYADYQEKRLNKVTNIYLMKE